MLGRTVLGAGNDHSDVYHLGLFSDTIDRECSVLLCFSLSLCCLSLVFSKDRRVSRRKSAGSFRQCEQGRRGRSREWR